MTKLIRQIALFMTVFLAAASSYAALPSCTPADLQGSLMPENAAADRTITVTPTTKNVNVKYGETVKFVMPGGQQVTWKFDGIGDNFPLNNILGGAASVGAGAPQKKGVQVYVDQSTNPLTRSCE